MRQFVIVCSFLQIVLVGAQNPIDAFSLFSEEEKVEILILGSFHFAEYNGDDSGNTFTATVPDVMTERRQLEIKALIDVLKKFGPTKICVERHRTKQEKLDSEFAEYSATEFAKKNEIWQVAGRLAKSLGHDRMYAVDASNAWYMDSVMQYAMSHGQGEQFMKLGQLMPAFLKEKYAAMDTMTMIEIMLHENQSEDLLMIHALHQSLCSIGNGSEYIGTNLYMDWMNRNARIFTNIKRVAQPRDRIFVLFGAAHVHALKHMFRDDLDFKVIEFPSIVSREK